MKPQNSASTFARAFGGIATRVRQMFFAENTLDDLLRVTFEAILRDGVRVKSTKGANTELACVLLKLKNPRARLSRTETKGTIFSCLGETLWYLSGSNDLRFIQYYIRSYKKFSDDGKTLYGAYGPRLFNSKEAGNQIATVIRTLKSKRGTRQAVLQLFDARDILKKRKDIPCTCTIQFLVRNNRLNAVVCMRSNDAFLGMPHDVFAFTFLQELVARSIGSKLGEYWHMAASLHIYDRDRRKVIRFLKEGWQSTISMPAMPPGDQWKNVAKTIAAEKEIRSTGKLKAESELRPAYWADITRLLRIFRYARDGMARDASDLRKVMVSKVFDVYIAKRISGR